MVDEMEQNLVCKAKEVNATATPTPVCLREHYKRKSLYVPTAHMLRLTTHLEDWYCVTKDIFSNVETHYQGLTDAIDDFVMDTRTTQEAQQAMVVVTHHLTDLKL
ncbi:hypothetical protein Pcinc_000220 [Petrolisthes cinctipes]|uniref:Uncharacterized protein n=1 Tax=Petrolisthes cinctipes TaxID=88211 RepID=A0AAE1GQB0_PETCI|nr:hypothetical protein Pcinc_000220 [Petrolisthes cinctipes]